jgi:hypothetical protein
MERCSSLIPPQDVCRTERRGTPSGKIEQHRAHICSLQRGKAGEETGIRVQHPRDAS